MLVQQMHIGALFIGTMSARIGILKDDSGYEGDLASYSSTSDRTTANMPLQKDVEELNCGSATPLNTGNGGNPDLKSGSATKQKSSHQKKLKLTEELSEPIDDGEGRERQGCKGSGQISLVGHEGIIQWGLITNQHSEHALCMNKRGKNPGLTRRTPKGGEKNECKLVKQGIDKS